jgi:hypothetical protein
MLYLMPLCLPGKSILKNPDNIPRLNALIDYVAYQQNFFVWGQWTCESDL